MLNNYYPSCLYTRNIDCDISMENCLALQNTRMLSAYAGIDTRVRQLGYTLKCFAKVSLK